MKSGYVVVGLVRLFIATCFPLPPVMAVLLLQRQGNWDLKTMMPAQCKLIDAPVPPHFDSWANIKEVFWVRPRQPNIRATAAVRCRKTTWIFPSRGASTVRLLGLRATRVD